MRVLFINTSATAGGAAIAASRLARALNTVGVVARLLVADAPKCLLKENQALGAAPDALEAKPRTYVMPQQRLRRMAFLWERFRIWAANGFRREGLWQVDIACAGVDVTRLQAFKEADVIHLHWINQGMLSMSQLQRIFDSGKPVVWTMHDMWASTAVCHYARDCAHYQSHCHHCPQLHRPSSHDLSWKVFEQKLHLYENHRLTFVGCSQWIADEALKSRLLRGHQVVSIPNTYDAALFHPASQTVAQAETQAEARAVLRHDLQLPADRRLLLFACQKVTDARKGLHYLIEALQSPNLGTLRHRLALVVVGQLSDEVNRISDMPIYSLGYIHDEALMAKVYQAVDAFVTPSLEDNLPNTIMESMACGTPCIGFRVGGIPEMIDHKRNGYLARVADANDLATGIAYVLDEARHETMATHAAEKAMNTWGTEIVALRFKELYKQLLPC